MKEYIVSIGKLIWVVTASDSKDAINQVYEKYKDTFYKEDFKA